MSSQPAPKFVTGSTMRHVVVMTATGSVGLMAIFVVDFLNLFYISLLGEQELAAAIGYAGTVLFFTTSLCIGISIAGTALVSRAIGAGRREEGRRLAASALTFMVAATLAASLVLLPLLGPILTLLGATGRTYDLAWRFLLIVTPSTPLLGLGMACGGLLRAAGDANRAMYMTLAGALVAAMVDPVLIFVIGLGTDGAAMASILSRAALAGVGLYGCVKVHDMVARPTVGAAVHDAPALAGVAVPAVLTNIATPVANAFVTATIARHGDSAVAGFAVVGRIIPLAFSAIFALSSSIGPILGQNLGAGRYDRLERIVTDSLVVTLIYCTAVWGLLVLLHGPIVALFGASGDGAALIRFFCLYVAGSFGFLGALFVANAAFNNLGLPTWSTVFNWGRATFGTVPFVLLGAKYFGAEGALAGQAAGGAVFGVVAVLVCYWAIRRLPGRAAAASDELPLSAPAVPPFSSGAAAPALDLPSSAETRKPSRSG